MTLPLDTIFNAWFQVFSYDFFMSFMAAVTIFNFLYIFWDNWLGVVV